MKLRPMVWSVILFEAQAEVEFCKSHVSVTLISTPNCSVSSFIKTKILKSNSIPYLKSIVIYEEQNFFLTDMTCIHNHKPCLLLYSAVNTNACNLSMKYVNILHVFLYSTYEDHKQLCSYNFSQEMETRLIITNNAKIQEEKK